MGTGRGASLTPCGPAQASTRIRKNVNYFKVNYLIWIATVLVVCMLASPASLFVLSGAPAAPADARAQRKPRSWRANSCTCARRHRCRVVIPVHCARRRAAGDWRAHYLGPRKAVGRVRRERGDHFLPHQRRLRHLLCRLHRSGGCVPPVLRPSHTQALTTRLALQAWPRTARCAFQTTCSWTRCRTPAVSCRPSTSRRAWLGREGTAPHERTLARTHAGCVCAHGNTTTQALLARPLTAPLSRRRRRLRPALGRLPLWP